jgi:hypothetical protein
MPLPDRPVSHAAIESVWGQAIHDYTFAPSGCEVHGTTNSGVSTVSKLTLSVADDDPGGYLDAGNNQVEVPTGGEGLYAVFVRVTSVNGSSGSGRATRGFLRLNGSDVTIATVDNAGGTTVMLTLVAHVVLVAGDILTVYGEKIGSGSNPDVAMDSFVLYRVGAEFGTP